MKRTEKDIFEYYKRDFLNLHNQHKYVRMITIEYVCQFPKIDPFEMARALVADGCRIVFDDSSISKEKNNKKYRRVYGV